MQTKNQTQPNGQNLQGSGQQQSQGQSKNQQTGLGSKTQSGKNDIEPTSGGQTPQKTYSPKPEQQQVKREQKKMHNERNLDDIEENTDDDEAPARSNSKSKSWK